jgi:hypothetical protein
MQGFEDGDAIYRKLILFLKDEVLDRAYGPVRRSKAGQGWTGRR